MSSCTALLSVLYESVLFSASVPAAVCVFFATSSSVLCVCFVCAVCALVAAGRGERRGDGGGSETVYAEALSMPVPFSSPPLSALTGPSSASTVDCMHGTADRLVSASVAHCLSTRHCMTQ